MNESNKLPLRVLELFIKRKSGISANQARKPNPYPAKLNASSNPPIIAKNNLLKT